MSEKRDETFSFEGEPSSESVDVNQKRIIQMNLRIPPNPPSDESCEIIKIRYYIYVRKTF